MRASRHHMHSLPARHATLRDPRVSHLKNQLAEVKASVPLLPKSRRRLSETVRGEFIHRTHQCFSPHRSFSSINHDHSVSASDSPSPGEESDFPLTDDLLSPELPQTLEMLVLRPDMQEELPPLPKINNQWIESQVFTHRSLYARSKHEFEDLPEDPAPDNEALELLGDSILTYVVTELIQQSYPNLRVGSATKIRSLIVGNNNFADISKRYKLPSRLQLQSAQAVALRASSHIQADVFEAYIGGLHNDQGMDVVKEWISHLFMPYVRQAHSIIKAQYTQQAHAFPSPPSSPTGSDDSPSESAIPGPDRVPLNAQSSHGGHVSLITQYVHRNNKSIEWVFREEHNEGTNLTPIWLAKALVDGQELAIGRGGTKKLAKNDAAKDAVEKLKLI